MRGLRVRIYDRTPDLEVEAGGLKFAFLFAIVIFAAINTGNNLIYLVLASFCGAVIVSWTLARLSLRGLSVRLRPPEEVYAGEETRIAITAGKRSGLLAGHSLAFELRSEPKLRGGHQPYVSRLAQGETIKLRGLFVFPRRGRYTLEGVHAVCNYPFGLIRPGKLFRQKEQIFVYPRIIPLEEMFERRSDGLMVRDSLRRGRGGGLLNIRPFVPGDDYRRLHWKASAKTGEMMLKEFAQEEGQSIWLHFNPLRRSELAKGDDELFELAVSVAASVAYHGRSIGRTMLYSAPGLRLVPERDSDHARRFLRYLAEVKTSGRLLTERPSIPARRSEDEMLLVIDPLNENIDWGSGAEVLDRRYFREAMEEGR